MLCGSACVFILRVGVGKGEFVVVWSHMGLVLSLYIFQIENFIIFLFETDRHIDGQADLYFTQEQIVVLQQLFKTKHKNDKNT